MSERWVRKATAVEEKYHYFYQQGFMLIGYVLRVATKKELHQQDARKVVTALYRSLHLS